MGFFTLIEISDVFHAYLTVVMCDVCAEPLEFDKGKLDLKK